MKKFNACCSLMLILMLSVPVAASELSITDSCAELVNIYKSHKEQRFLAAQTTSLSEGLRAGYCLGVLEQYSKNHYRCRSNWFKRAKFIAQQQGLDSYFSEQELLEKSCER
ncbi:hypothetical protein [Neptunomonas japonica]|uniref:Uncharacterized protein n=1 Tax=Neptunomonas japonica JAMM 1380 TaxID=1441457 RepID=A0A7R6SVR8_9GAMM|nr:hypothetical protein [Neptunomonas japonica]BBB29879.1 conserved hypothetical protein [Neptunomonas japonica JAMM 1380]